MPEPPWKHPVGLDAAVHDWMNGKRSACFTLDRRLPGRAPQHADFPADLGAGIASALRTTGVERLYSHQRAAWDAAARGTHLVIATPTASGKSLCFHLPVLEALA